MVALLVIGFIVLLLCSVPVGIILCIVSVIPVLANPSYSVDLSYLFRNLVAALDSTTLVAIPMFMLSGVIMAKGGIASKLYDFFAFFVGKLPGGLPACTVLTCLFYGAISGSGPATTAAVGSMSIPLLLDLGYDLKFCAALVAVAGGLGIIIPPSVPFILYSSSAGTSVGNMFIAGIIPGCLIGLMLIIYAMIYCKKNGEDRVKINAKVNDLHARGFFDILKSGIWALLSPIIVLGGIYGGIMTPTEASVISVVYALIVGLFIYKEIKISDIIPMLAETARTVSSCLIITGAAAVFAKAVLLLRIPVLVQTALGGIAENRILLLIFFNIVLLIAGMLMDTAAGILIFTPIMLPMATAVGINPIHLGVIMICNLAIGFVTPPVGMNLYVAASMSKLKAGDIAKKAMPMLGFFMIALLFITYVEALSLILLQ